MKKCVICGKLFEPKQSNYTTCSKECSIANARFRSKAWLKTDVGAKKMKEYQRRYRKAHQGENTKVCKTCDKPLENGNQTYCLNCLLKDYKYNNSHTAIRRLNNRGISAKDAREEIRLRGI